MAKSTKTTYKPAKKGNYKSVVRMAEGGNVSELDYSERREYIEENYAPFITDAQMIFSIYDSGIEYDYKGDRKQVTQSIIEQYKSLADYTESTLPQETIYEIQDWDLVRKEIDPDTDEVIGETPLEQVSSDNTYNFSYNGLVDLNWRVYHDEEYDRFFYVIMPHLGGDIRGNYGDAIILEGNDKEELFYRFYEGFISGGASIYIKFKDGSEIGFDSEQDSDVFYFRVNEVFEPTGMAQKYLNDFEKFDSWKGDEFLEETIDIYLARNGVVPMMMAGGSLNDENPMAYIQILGYDEGKYFNLTDYADGQDVINGIYEWMNGLNEQFGGNREEYEVTDYEGFGDDLYDAYMGENEFDEIIEAYEKYQSSDFPADVISAYKNDSGSRNDSLSDVIDEMDNNYFGKYENLKDFGYEMVQQGVYEPSENDVYITDTDKRIIAGEEADSKVDDMRFEDLMDVALDTQSDYENEKSELEDKISEIQSEIDDLTDLQSSVDDDDEYETIAEQIEEKEVELDDVQNELDNIDSRFEDEAREEARELFYDEIYNKLENDLEDWLYEYGYNTGNLADVSFLSIDYEKIGDELSSDYLIVEFDGSMYFFNNYSKGGRIMASKIKPKFDYYIVENNTKKLVSGYSTKGEAIEQRKLLVKEYPSMRFEIFTLGNLEKKTDLDVYAKKDYVELSTLDKIKKVSVDAYRYGQEKVEQTNEFLKKHDVKGRIKRGARKVTDKTKQGGNWLKKQWREADFGDGTGRARFFADGGGVESLKVGSKVGFLRPRTGRYEYAEVLSIDGNNVNLVVRHPKRSQWDNYFTETKERITKFLNTPSEDWKDGRPVFKVKYADGGSLDGELFKVHYLKVFEDGEQGDTVFVKEIYGKNENEAISKFKKTHGNYKIEYVSKYADGGGVDEFEQLPFGYEVAFYTQGDYELEIDDFIDKLKIIHKHIEFDNVLGESDSFNTDLKFLKNGNSIASLVGSYNENTERYDSEFIFNDYSSNINFHPYNTMGGFYKGEFDLEIKNAVSESKTYSAVVSIEGYEVEGQEFTDEKIAKTGIKDLKEKTEFNLVRGKKFGQGKRVEQDRVINKFADGGGVAQLPPKGELTNKDNLLLKYQKNGSEYEFYIYEPVTKNVSAYQQNKYLCKNKDCPIKMTYNQFINYLYTETYLDDLKYENGGEADALFEIVVVAKGLEKDGGQIIKDRFSINSISVNEAKNIAEKMWEKEMANSDFHIIDILTDTEYREKYLSKKFNKGGESKGEYDVYDNKRMLLNQANEIEHHSEELIEQVNNTKKVPAWVVAKMERATTDLSDITHYLDGENKMAHGGNVVDVTYEVLPHINKFIVAKVTYKQHEDYTYPSKEFIYGFNDKLLEFDDIKSAQKFIDNIVIKYPFGGVEKASYGAILLASQFAQKQQPQQIVYYIPQQQQEPNTDIIQNIPEMANGGDVGYDDETINDFCITNLIELANELQSVRYYVTNRFKESDFESKTYKGRLTIVFKEPASINVINSLSKFLERAEDCHHIFEQSVNVSGSEANGLSINLLSDKFSDFEFGKGGKVYDFAPKKINISKTKKITTHLGDFNLALITKDFVYFVNMEESDENGNTMMYNKNGELLSDNYFASNELHETLEKESTFDFIHPMMEIQRQEILKEN
jgi:hypothetical protein